MLENEGILSAGSDDIEEPRLSLKMGRLRRKTSRCRKVEFLKRKLGEGVLRERDVMDFSQLPRQRWQRRQGRRQRRQQRRRRRSVSTTCKCIIMNSTYALSSTLSTPSLGNSTPRPIESFATSRVITGDAPKHRPRYLAHTTWVDVPCARRRWRK